MPFASLPFVPPEESQPDQDTDPVLGTLVSQVVPFGATFDRQPLRDGNFDAKTIEESFRRIDELLETPTVSFTNLEIMARLLRGTYFRKKLKASTAGSPLDDTAILHGLGRRPSVVMLGVDLLGCGGLILGAPKGLLTADGGNLVPWDSERIFLRATKTSTYEGITL